MRCLMCANPPSSDLRWSCEHVSPPMESPDHHHQHHHYDDTDDVNLDVIIIIIFIIVFIIIIIIIIMITCPFSPLAPLETLPWLARELRLQSRTSCWHSNCHHHHHHHCHCHHFHHHNHYNHHHCHQKHQEMHLVIISIIINDIIISRSTSQL